MATNITLRIKSPDNKDHLIYQQATPDYWGDGEPPSPIEFEEKYNIITTQHECPCGGGMYCLVDRRKYGYLVMEDKIFIAAKCKLRNNCYEPMTKTQEKLMEKA
jgi:hypothetical protein